jgi:magnesium chelatase family protein
VCTPLAVRNYRGRVSGPLLDRFDIHMEVGRVPAADLEEEKSAESSAEIRRRVTRAREAQTRRFARGGERTNAAMSAAQLKEHCVTGTEGRRLLRAAVERLGLSARAHHRILKVARTLADLDGDSGLAPRHVAEAIQYRLLDRGPL